MKNKNIFKNRKFYMLTSVFLMIGLFTMLFISDYLKPNEIINITSDTGYYEVKQHPITDIVDDDGESIFSIKNLYEYTGTFSLDTFTPKNDVVVDSSKYIGIGNMEELVAFSWLCNPDKNPTDSAYRKYLGYKYVLTNNISPKTNLRFIPVGVEENYPFTGEFNGNGFDIEGLNFLFITNVGDSGEELFDEKYPNTSNAIEYLSMFSRNNGTICNVGLINTSINANYMTSDNFYKASPLCGENMTNGVIDRSYVRDLRDTSREAGLLTIGGFTISGMVFRNDGVFTNSYSAYTYVVNSAVDDYNDFNEIIYENTSTKSNQNGVSNGVSKLYFYNSSISSIDGEKKNTFVSYTGNTVNVAYSTGLTSNRTYNGIYCPTLDILNSKIKTDDSSTEFPWRVTSDYGAVNGGYLIEFMPTPILRGVNISEGNVISITNVRDYAFLYEMLNANAKFADSKFTYQIESNINLSSLDYTRYKYDGPIEATITGLSGTYNSVKIGGTYSSYPTIYYPDLENTYVKVEGFNAYGLFPYFYGKLENLNIVLSKYSNSEVKEYDITVDNYNIAAFGGAVGYLDSGSINNVNVYGNIKLNGTSKVFAGGAVGVVTGFGKVEEITTKGSIDVSLTATKSNPINYLQGEAIGGVVGYIDSVSGSINTLLNTMNITTSGLASVDFAIGGILGAGYTNNAFDLQNEGNITIGTDSANADYNNLFVAGCIGRHLGMTNKITGVNNYGNITAYAQSTNTLYIAGVVNAAPVTSSNSSAGINKSDSYLLSNNYKINGKNTYLASRIINGANIIVKNNSNANNFYSDVINLITYECNVYLSGIYNLPYSLKAATTDTIPSKVALGNQLIDMEGAYEFAGIISNQCNTRDVYNLETVYNLRNIEFNLSSALASTTKVDLNYAGVALGKNMNFTDVRNEGSLSYTFAEGSSVATTSTMKVSGVFETLSNNFLATSIFNGGSIAVIDSASSDIKVDLYLSGVCYENLSVINSDEQNPLNESFNNKLVGSLNNTINNGKILVTSTDYDKTDLKVSQTTGESNNAEKATQTSTTNFIGKVYAAGVTYSNLGIISNTFNLGDVQLDVFAKQDNTYYYAAGIATVMSEDYAQVRDSANNGKIQVINMSNNSSSIVLVGGIFAINVDSNKKDNIKEIVAFSINYGTLIGFNGYEWNNTSNADINKLHSLVGGISAKGVCNIINVLNYGNIYGSEAVGSIIGAFDLNQYNDVKVDLANVVNYSSVQALVKYKYSGATLSHANFNDVENLAFLGTGEYSGLTSQYYYLGSMFGFINYQSRTNINVRYIINFFNGAYITQEINQKNAPTNPIDTSTFITVNGSSDKFGGGSVSYAPLSAITDTDGNIGVFSEKFIFRRAINGDSEVINPNKVTDSYIADFFQFVRFDKVNDILLEKIGWKNIAYLNAAEQLARDVKTMAVFTDGSHAGLAKTTVTPNFTSNTWYENIDDTLLLNFLNESLSNDDGNTTEFSSSDLKEILEYILFDTSCISAISSSIRNNIIDTIIKYYDELGTNYSTLLQKLLYDELLAKVVSGEDTNYSEVQSRIRSVINSAGNTELRSVMDNYLDLLLADTNNTILTPLFETLKSDGSDYYVYKKMELIKTLLSGYDTTTLDEMASEILPESLDVDENLKYFNYLSSHSGAAIDIYAHLITQNSLSDNSNYLNVINESLSKYDSLSAIDTAFDGDNIIDDFDNLEYTQYFWAYDKSKNDDEIPDTIKNNFKVTNNYTWINGTKWDISKDYTELWNIVKNNIDVQNYISTNYFSNHKDPTSDINYNSLIAKATEKNNTYQSNDGPSVINETTGKNKNSSNFGSYNINNGGIFRNSYNDSANNPYQVYLNNGTETNIKGKSQLIKNRFIYTPDSVNSYATNYYGPYMANGQVFNTAWTKPTAYTFKGLELYDSSNISETKKRYAPIFISTNQSITENAIANSSTNATNKAISPFYWNNMSSEKGGNVAVSSGASYEWASDYIVDNEPKDASNYLYKNYKTGEYIVDYYDFTPDKSITWTSDMTEANTTINYEGHDIVLNLSGAPQHAKSNPWETWTSSDNPNNYKFPLREHFLIGYATSSIITGIWYVHSVYKTTKVVGTYLCAKEGGGKDSPAQGDFNSYQGIQTTQYTYYQMDDLVALDGKRTKGKSGGIADADEKAIISAIMTNILSTNDGKKLIVKALASYSKTNIFTPEQFKSANFVASALRGTSFASTAVTETISQQSAVALRSEYYIRTSMNLEQKLNDLVSNDSVFTAKEKLIMSGATDKSVFKKILLYTLTDNSDLDNGGTNEITSKDLTYFIYKYVEKLQELYPSMTREQITQLLSTANSDDLVRFTQLSNLTWNNFIKTVGGDADVSQSDTGYGAPLDLASLYTTLGGTSQTSKDTAVKINTKNAYPIKAKSQTIISKTGSTNAYKPDGNNAQNIEFASTQAAASTNIGYIVGGDINLYRKTNYIDYSTFYHAATSDYSTPLTGDDAPDQSIVDYLTSPATDSNGDYIYELDSDGNYLHLDENNNPIPVRNGDFMLRLSHESKMTYNTKNSYYVVENGLISETTSDLLLPRYCILVSPIQTGIMKFVVVGGNQNKTGFRVEKLQRRTSHDYTTSFYENSTNVIEVNAQILPGKAYYYEYEVTSSDILGGYEFAITCGDGGQGDGYKPFVTYIDMGTSGGDSMQVKYPDLSDIETRYNSNYARLTNMGDFLASNMITKHSTSITSITVTEPTILFVKTTNVSDGKITINGSSTYTVTTTNDTTITSVSKKTNGTYRAFYLSGGTYSISVDNATVSDIISVPIDNSITYTTDGNTITYNDGSSSKLIFGGTDYGNLSSFNLNVDLIDEIKETLAVVYPSMITGSGDNKEYYFFNDATIGDSATINLFTLENKKDIIKYLAKADFKNNTSALGRLINNLQTSFYDDLLLSISDKTVKLNIVKKIVDIANTSSTRYAGTEDLIIAAFIGQDYLNYSVTKQLTKTKLYTLLGTYQGGIYQFIESDEKINATKFNEFLVHLGVKANLEGYGIFALSSSQGIKNGEFIPDNLSLGKMDVSYEHDDTYGIVLKKTTVNQEVTYPKSADWRKYGTVSGGDTTHTGDNDTSKKDSVNYGFIIEMKQLKKAIATTIFELDLSTTVDTSQVSNYIMYSSEDLIDLASENKNIVYYVPSNYLQQFVNNTKTLSIADLVYSTTAEPYSIFAVEGSDNAKIIRSANGTYNTTFSTSNLIACTTVKRYKELYPDSYVLVEAITIVAEDTTVYEKYDLIFRPIDYSFNSKYQTIDGVTEYSGTPTDTEATILANNAVISLKVTSPLYILNKEGSFKVGSKYYEYVEGAYKLTEDTTYDDTKNYYSVFVKATEKNFKADTTYYKLTDSTYTAQSVTVGGINDGSYYIATTANKLPKGFDLSNYVSITNQTDGALMFNAFTFKDDRDNCIVDANGEATITMLISNKLPQGVYNVNINLYGNNKSVKLTKAPNDDSSLTVYYNDSEIINSSDNNETTSILWGQPFSKYELETLSYLDSYVLAPNATKTVTVSTKYEDKSPANILKYSVCTYTVTIVVTAEDGSSSTYTHTLKEQDPFANGTQYANVYKNGELFATNPTIGTPVEPDSDTTNELHVKNNVMKVYFTRDEGQPDYRVKYSFNKIYYTEDEENVTFDKSHYNYNEYTDNNSSYSAYVVKAKTGEVTAATFSGLIKRLCIKSNNKYVPLASNATYDSSAEYYFYHTEAMVSLPYAGFNISVVSTMDTGNYVFGYTYKNYTFNATYFESVYTDVQITNATFKNDGTFTESVDGYLYTETGGVYSKVTSGSYDGTKTYYVLSYKATEDSEVLSGKTYYSYSDGTYSKATLTVGGSFETMGAKERVLEFPKIEIVKCPSLDALVESITFIKEYEALSAMSTLIHPNYSIVPNSSANNKNANEPIYYDILDGTGQLIEVETNSRSIKYDTYATSTNDYYVVGTTSEANLDDYAPSLVLNSKYAKVFQFLSPTKYENYTGASDSTYTDYGVLGNHSDNTIYLYAQFEDSNGNTKVYLIATNLFDMSYTAIYDANAKFGSVGDDDTNLTKVVDLPSGLKGNDIYNIEFTDSRTSVTYTASKINGETDLSNSSLFMNFAKETFNNRFWYVSYVVFSEDFFIKGLGAQPTAVAEDDVQATATNWGNRIKFYNIAIIDISNNVRFVLEVDAPEDFNEDGLDSIYVTFAYNKYVSTVLADTKQLSAYADYEEELYTYNSATDTYGLVTGELNATTKYYFFDKTTNKYQQVSWSNNGTKKYDTFISQYSLQLLPTAYYTFTVDLPQGYEATYKIDKVNPLPADAPASEANSYLPPSSLVTQTIRVTITIEERDSEDVSTWGISTSTVRTVVATPNGNLTLS